MTATVTLAKKVQNWHCTFDECIIQTCLKRE